MHQAVEPGSVVAVTGAAGFVGRYVVRELAGRGYRVRALVRDRQAARDVLPVGVVRGTEPAVALVEGDVFDPRAMDELLTSGGPARACINLIGIIREEAGQTFRKAHVEATRACIEACQRAGRAQEPRPAAKTPPVTGTRFIQMSALGVGYEGVTEYQRTKYEAEELVRRSGLLWTIFRPGMIHGAGSKFVKMVQGWVSGEQAPWIFIPYFTRVVPDTRVPLGPFNRKEPVVQPVFVEDVARAFATALERPGAIGEVYNLVGSETLSWPRMMKMFRDELPGGTDTLLPFGLPALLAARVAKAAKFMGLGDLLPFDEGMARMGGEDSTAEGIKVREQLGLTPRGFSETLPMYAPAV